MNNDLVSPPQRKKKKVTPRVLAKGKENTESLMEEDSCEY